MDSFATLFDRAGTDKQSRHQYGRIYDLLFPPLFRRACRRLSILELAGPDLPSLRAWSMAFTDAEIWGAGPLTIATDPGPRIRTYRLRQSDAAQLQAFAQDDAVPFFDIIIDASGRPCPELVLTLSSLWRKLRRGGYYAIEAIADADTIQTLARWPNGSRQGEHKPVVLETRHLTEYANSRLLVWTKPDE